ncbi:MAG: hypothetical protein IJY65_05270 [Clostridia bacterium]|nr:hypothetical protein [Clostridia bacterium]
MNDFVALLLIVLAVFCLYKLVMLTVKRILLIRSLSSLKASCEATVRYLRNPFASFFKKSEIPDVAVEIRDTVYLIRIISDGGVGRRFHFASKNFTVAFTNFMFVGAPVSRRVVGARAYRSEPLRLFKRVRIYPDMKVPTEYELSGKKIALALIFNPAPGNVSYVTENKTSIKVAFTGDEIYGQRVFTASTFAAFADREAHKTDEFKYFNYK